MNGTAAKADRRDLRRAVGASALDIIDQQSATIRQLVEVSNSHTKQIRTALEDIGVVHDLILSVGAKQEAFAGMSRWQRLCWLVVGR